MEGYKDIENRNVVSHHRGELLIHASSNRTDLADNIKWVLDTYDIDAPKEELQFGCLIGSVEMTGCVEDHESDWFNAGGYGYVLASPRRIRPIPLKANAGMQKTYDVEVIYQDQAASVSGKESSQSPSLNQPKTENPRMEKALIVTIEDSHPPYRSYPPEKLADWTRACRMAGGSLDPSEEGDMTDKDVLEGFFEAGWRVKMISPFGGTGCKDPGAAACLVILEKDSAESG